MSAETIAKALGGRKVGSNWSACCPTHDDRTPSLSLRDSNDGKVLVRCHAGCNQQQVIASLKARGLWTQNSRIKFRNVVSKPAIKPTALDREDIKRTKFALSIWLAAKEAGGTLIETYLESRGLQLPNTTTLRFHPCLKHPSGDYWPTMIALVTHGFDGTPLAIHRTFLARNGAGKAPVKSQKLMLGPCHGGVVRLAESGNTLMVGEGIETCLAAAQASGLPAWAALSTSGLRALDLPSAIRDVIVLADGDDPGEKASRECALRWIREGRRVRIARPPKGMDFNDMLLNLSSTIAGGPSEQ